MADHRLRLRSGSVGPFLLELARQIRTAKPSADLNALLSQSPDLALPEGVDPAWIRECANDLVAHGKQSLILVGRRLPVSLQALALALNATLGAVGSTLIVQPRRSIPSSNISQLAGKIRNGTIRTLIILGGDPVYNAPADLNWPALQSSVPNTIHLAHLPNATSKQSTWSIPGTHYLESWGDALASDGSYLSIQPMIQPLWDGQSQVDLLSKLLGQPKPIGPGLIRDTFAQRTNLQGEKLDQAWNDFVREGFLAASTPTLVPRTPNLSSVAGLLSKIENSAPEDISSLEFNFIQSGAVDDGRYANNGWMQEWPDPMTKLTWDNAVLMSQDTAKSLGLKNEVIKGILVADVVKATLAGRSVEAPALIVPGHANFSVSLPLGYGQEELGSVAKGSGFNAYSLRTSMADYQGAGLQLKNSVKPANLRLRKNIRLWKAGIWFVKLPYPNFRKIQLGSRQSEWTLIFQRIRVSTQIQNSMANISGPWWSICLLARDAMRA